MKNKAGVYIIQNLLNGKVYVGASRNVHSRLSDHKVALRGGYHVNLHLLSAYKKNGEHSFLFDVLEYCDERYIYSQENYWCNMLNAHNRKFGYNIDPTSPEGKIAVSEETKQRMSMSAPKRTIQAYTVYGEFYDMFSDLYKCAAHFDTVAPNIHRKMNNVSPKKYLIDSKSSRYIFVDDGDGLSEIAAYWKDVFNQIKCCNGKYLVYDCFDRFIGKASSKELSEILNVSLRSVANAVGRNTYLKTLKIVTDESSNR